MADNITRDIWSPLGEESWRKLAEGTAATELQIRFAAARFSGASASGAAKLAGYSGNADSIRRAGYSALRSTQVQNLLELASVAAPKEGKITDVEIDAKLSRLIRSGDPATVTKAISLHDERERRKKELGQTPDDDGFNMDRCVRDLLLLPNGAGMAMLLQTPVALSRMCLFHDMRHKLKDEPLGNLVWQALYERHSETMRQDIAAKLAQPGYQMATRKRIWAEIGKKPIGPVEILDHAVN